MSTYEVSLTLSRDGGQAQLAEADAETAITVARYALILISHSEPDITVFFTDVNDERYMIEIDE